MNQQVIPLSALSAAQRALVERHLPLVRMAMRRVGRAARRFRPERDERDLFQEGVLALAEAVRRHDPSRHSGFAAYAMSRIEFALSRYAQEQGPAIRVPMITQRRRRARARENADRHHPDAAPRVWSLSERMMPTTRHRVRRARPDHPSDREESFRDSSRLGDHLHRVMDEVIGEMKRSTYGRRGYRRVVEECARQRWMIPEPTEQTPLRALAKELGCSVGRLTRCERRFRDQVAKRLIAQME